MQMKKYPVIYADPPWQYRVYSQKGLGRSAESHYPTMGIDEIRALPVAELAEKDCALFLWVTIPCLLEGLSVLQAWGFQYKTIAFVWIKQNKKADSLFWGWDTGQGAMLNFVSWQPEVHQNGSLPESIR